jgi:GH35 family endo-1,4-beta-xylanase
MNYAEEIMATIRSILSVLVLFVLASCGTSTPTPYPVNIPTSTSTEIPLPPDIPVYQNSFEGITDLSASGITSDAEITPDTVNFNYPGPGTALKIKGILPDVEYSSLEVVLSIKKLTGEDSLDLSNKTLGISFYIPENSPLSTFNVLISRGDKLVILGVTEGSGWIDYSLDVKSIYEAGTWVFTNATDDEAREMIQRCETIKFVALKDASAAAGTEVEFSLDDLSWIGLNDVNHIQVNDSVDSLRKYAAGQHFKFGMWTNYQHIFGWDGGVLDPWWAYMVVQEGSVSDISFFPVLEEDDLTKIEYNGPGDPGDLQIHEFSKGNNLTMVGYNLGQWYATVPQWIRDLSYPDQTRAVLLHSIEEDLTYSKGRNPIWMLFNEAVQGYDEAIPFSAVTFPIGLNNRQNTDPNMSGCCYSPWAADINDTSLIKDAYVKAHEVDPGATLIFTGVGNEVMGRPMADYWYQLLSGLKAEGVPIDGVGFEMHQLIMPDGRIRSWIFSPLTDLRYSYLSMDDFMQGVDANIKRYASAGLKVAFTELDGFIKIDDLDFNTPEGRAEYENRLQWQAKYYAGLMKIAMENENVILYKIFQITDKYGIDMGPIDAGFGNSGIFDKNYHPKPAYFALLDQLKNP